MDRRTPRRVVNRVGRKFEGGQLLVELQVSFAITYIPPKPVVDHDSAQFLAGTDEFQEMRNDRPLYAGFEAIDERGAHNIYASKDMSGRYIRAELIADVDDA